ncbi:MAG: CHAT domain-containing protein, partial [Acidobacteria bacterium]
RHASGQSAAAQPLYEEALARFAELGDELQAAVTRSSALFNLAYLGDYDVAYAWARSARQTFERLDDRPRLAILEHNLANVLGRQDRWEEALESYRRAERAFRRLGRPHDVAICQRNMAVCHITLHDFAAALAVYEKSRAYCVAEGLEQLVLEVDYNIAYLYYLRGEYTRAIRGFEEARSRCRVAGDAYHQALCDLDQAEIYLELNLVEEAAELAGAAHASFARQGLPYETAKALTFRALALSRRGDDRRSLRLLERARAIFVGEKNRLWPALIDFYRAVVLYRQEQPREALGLAQRARRAFAGAALKPRVAMCELLLAQLHLRLGDHGRARALCRAVLDLLAEIELPALACQAYRVLGQVEEAAGDRTAALAAYRRSGRWLERLRSQLRGEDLKIAFVADKQAVYESLAWLTLQHRAGDERERTIFDVVEKAKSRSLVDLLAFRAHTLEPRAAEQSELAERVRQLRAALSGSYRQIDRRLLDDPAPAAERLRRLRRRAKKQEDELLRAQRALRRADRELGSLQSATAVELDALRAALPDAAVLVEYFIARDAVIACVADRRRLTTVTLAPAAEVASLHRLLRFQLTRPLIGGPSQEAVAPLVSEAIQAHLGALHRRLVAPLMRYVEGEHLIIAPHRFLHFVPFHALAGDGAYLIDRFSISYAPSASVLYLCAVKRPAWRERSLVLGVADERAPHILEEARAVAEALPRPTLLLGDAASAEALAEHAPGCRHLHLATHGLFRRDNPMFSAIQLGGSRLSLFDLYDLRLDAELVVLSGCGTGLGAVRGGDELVGLTRGLLYAGAHSVVVSLWDVHDASTATFMRDFYRHLAAGRGAADALRRAIRELRRRYPDPYHWAPFVLVGKPGLDRQPPP